jgi:hypothetical protein
LREARDSAAGSRFGIVPRMGRIAARWKLAPCGIVATAIGAIGASGCAGLLDLDVHYVDGDASAEDATPPADASAPDGAGTRDGAARDGSIDDAADSRAPADADAAAPVDADATAPADADATAIDAAADGADAADAADAADEQVPEGGAPIEFVQVVASQALTGSATATIAFALPVAAHDTLVVAADYDSLGTLQISDTLGSHFVAAGQPTFFGYTSTLYYALDVPSGGADTVALTLSQAPTTFFEYYIHEYSGIGAFDGASAGTGTYPMMVSGFTSTTAPNDLVFGFAATGTATAGDGFTARSGFNNNLTEDEIVGPPGPYQATATMTAGGSWTLLMAAFRPR